ncbi:IS982 family transposase [Candidatus Lariskella endosymbiont of Hedychridium roseum]|uniref:IS982 family transposase n=2 Tax=Candidatus Lariskella endosymbiont of Hedychridium roseum TaxID=3077949 RepID=UPI0030D1A44C
MVPLLELYCYIDDFCKLFEEQLQNRGLCSERRLRHRQYMLSLSEIITILVMFQLSHYRTFKDFYKDCLSIHYASEFPRLVSYNRFVELMKHAVVPQMVMLRSLSGSKTGKYYIDSTKLEVCHNMRIRRHKVFKDIAKRGKTSTGWFFGFKLHIIMNDCGEIINISITPGNKDDRAVVENLARNLKGWLFGDRGYICKNIAKKLRAQGLELITRLKKNMKEKLYSEAQKSFLNKRNFIETAIGQLKNICHIQHTRHRSTTNFLANLFAGITAYTLKPNKPAVSWKNKIINLALISN